MQFHNFLLKTHFKNAKCTNAIYNTTVTAIPAWLKQSQNPIHDILIENICITYIKMYNHEYL